MSECQPFPTLVSAVSFFLQKDDFRDGLPGSAERDGCPVHRISGRKAMSACRTEVLIGKRKAQGVPGRPRGYPSKVSSSSGLERSTPVTSAPRAPDTGLTWVWRNLMSSFLPLRSVELGRSNPVAGFAELVSCPKNSSPFDRRFIPSRYVPLARRPYAGRLRSGALRAGRPGGRI